MSIYILSKINQQAYNNISSAVLELKTHACVPKMNIEETLYLYKKVLSESPLGYLYNQNEIHVSYGLKSSNINFEFCRDALERRITVDTYIYNEMNDIIGEAISKSSLYEKVEYIYRYFVENFTYASSEMNNQKYHSAVSVFLYRKSVCEGFALAMSLILNRLGILCGIVVGTGYFEGVKVPHAWNIVEIDSQYYHLDVTWDICLKISGSVIYDYFLLDAGTMENDHYWEDSSIPLADDKSMDWYRRNKHFCISEEEIRFNLENDLKKCVTNIGIRCEYGLKDKYVSTKYAKKIFDDVTSRLNISYSKVSCQSNQTAGTIKYVIEY